MVSDLDMETYATIENVTFSQIGQLYWTILLESNLNFLIHSATISSFNTTVTLADSILDVPSDHLLLEIPVDDPSNICLDDYSQHPIHRTKTVYCPNSSPSSSHQIIIFQSGSIGTNVSSRQHNIASFLLTVICAISSNY